MTLTVQPVLFQAWCICVVVLFAKMFANSLVQGFFRISNRHFVNPEDAASFGKGAQAQDAPHPMVTRAAACWRNDLENIPIFLIISLAAVLLTPSDDTTPLLAAMGVFVLGRCLHTFSYLRALQPWRTLSFSLGVLSTFFTCALVLSKAAAF